MDARTTAVALICEFARTFRDDRIRSPREIYAATGYAGEHAAISQEAIEAALAARPDLIEYWLGYSEDKRCSAGWYMTKRGNRWTVGYFSSDRGRVWELLFESPVRACACLVRLEMECLRSREEQDAAR